jgi:hypothetical protein
MSHFLLLEMQECVIKSDKHEFDVIWALHYWGHARSNWNLKMLIFTEGGKPEDLEKNPRGK